MRSWLAEVALAVIVLAVAVVGGLDALFIEEHDFAALYGLIAATAGLQVALCLRSRRAVTIRPDLARDVRRRSQLTGEAAGRIADRALAEHLAELGDAVGPAGVAAGDGRRPRR